MLCKKLGFFIMALAASATFFYGCKRAEQSVKINDDTVLAEVNGNQITVANFKAACNFSIPEKEEEKEEVLRQIISNKLITDYSLHKGYNGQGEIISALKMMHADYLPKILKSEIEKNIVVKDEEIPTGEIADTPILGVNVIITPTMEKAEAALKDIRAGLDFEEAAKKYSIGISGKTGGYIGQIDMGSSIFEPGVKAILNKMKAGEVSPIIKTNDEYSLFKIKSRKEPADLRRQAIMELRDKIKKQKLENEMSALITRLRAGAKIEYNEKFLNGDFSQDWAARVNGAEIRVSEGLLSGQGDPMHMPHLDMKFSSIKLSVQRLIDNLLLTDEARRRGLDQTPDYLKFIKVHEERVIAGDFLEKGLGPFTATPEDIKGYYDKYKNRFDAKASVHIKRILVGTREEANAALAKIKDGYDFSKAALDYSIDKSKSTGGDMGWFTVERLAPSFRNVIEGLDKGQVSEVFKSEYGYEILKLEERKAGGVPDLSEIWDKIEKKVILQKRSTAVEDLYKMLYGKAKIKVNKELLEKISR